MWWHTVTHGGEVKGKLANGVGSQYSHTTSERGVSSITNADAHTSAASSRLNWLPRRFKWTRPFRRKTKCGFCACAIRFRTSSTSTFPLCLHGILWDDLLLLILLLLLPPPPPPPPPPPAAPPTPPIIIIIINYHLVAFKKLAQTNYNKTVWT